MGETKCHTQNWSMKTSKVSIIPKKNDPTFIYTPLSSLVDSLVGSVILLRLL